MYSLCTKCIILLNQNFFKFFFCSYIRIGPIMFNRPRWRWPTRRPSQSALEHTGTRDKDKVWRRTDVKKIRIVSKHTEMPFSNTTSRETATIIMFCYDSLCIRIEPISRARTLHVLGTPGMS